MPIRLQHEAAKLHELSGATCSMFCAIENAETGFVGPLYLKADNRWHRFYLDAGLLFWEEGPEPDPVEDLLEGERYVDLGVVLGVTGQRLADVEMSNSQLRIEFREGARLLLEHGPRDQGTRVVERTRGKT